MSKVIAGLILILFLIATVIAIIISLIQNGSTVFFIAVIGAIIIMWSMDRVQKG